MEAILLFASAWMLSAAFAFGNAWYWVTHRWVYNGERFGLEPRGRVAADGHEADVLRGQIEGVVVELFQLSDKRLACRVSFRVPLYAGLFVRFEPGMPTEGPHADHFDEDVFSVSRCSAFRAGDADAARELMALLAPFIDSTCSQGFAIEIDETGGTVIGARAWTTAKIAHLLRTAITFAHDVRDQLEDRPPSKTMRRVEELLRDVAKARAMEASAMPLGAEGKIAERPVKLSATWQPGRPDPCIAIELRLEPRVYGRVLMHEPALHWLPPSDRSLRPILVEPSVGLRFALRADGEHAPDPVVTTRTAPVLNELEPLGPIRIEGKRLHLIVSADRDAVSRTLSTLERLTIELRPAKPSSTSVYRQLATV